MNLLCLLVEAGREIPEDRCQLYREGLEILLSQWDEAYHIQGDRLYKNLSVQHKQDLLSKIALATFEIGENFSKQDVESSIAEDMPGVLITCDKDCTHHMKKLQEN